MDLQAIKRAIEFDPRGRIDGIAQLEAVERSIEILELILLNERHFDLFLGRRSAPACSRELIKRDDSWAISSDGGFVLSEGIGC